jgi:hypothetical protein
MTGCKGLPSSGLPIEFLVAVRPSVQPAVPIPILELTIWQFSVPSGGATRSATISVTCRYWRVEEGYHVRSAEQLSGPRLNFADTDCCLL